MTTSWGDYLGIPKAFRATMDNILSETASEYHRLLNWLWDNQETSIWNTDVDFSTVATEDGEARRIIFSCEPSGWWGVFEWIDDDTKYISSRLKAYVILHQSPKIKSFSVNWKKFSEQKYINRNIIVYWEATKIKNRDTWYFGSCVNDLELSLLELLYNAFDENLEP
jgi:hypothetical protein